MSCSQTSVAELIDVSFITNQKIYINGSLSRVMHNVNFDSVSEVT